MFACTPPRSAPPVAPAVVPIRAAPPAASASAAESARNESALLGDVQREVDALVSHIGASENEAALTRLAELLNRLGFTSAGFGPPEMWHVANAMVIAHDFDGDPELEYLVQLEARYDNPNAGSGDQEPSGSLYLAWLDRGPDGYRVLGRHAIQNEEGASFDVTFEPFHDAARDDTRITESWSTRVNAARSGTNVDVVTLARGKVEIVAHAECGQVDFVGSPPRKIVCDRCIPTYYAAGMMGPGPTAQPCADNSKPTLVWDAASFSYK